MMDSSSLPSSPNDSGNLPKYAAIMSYLAHQEQIKSVLDFGCKGGNGLALLAARYGIENVQGYEVGEEERAHCASWYPALERRLITELKGVSLSGGTRERAIIALDLFQDWGGQSILQLAEQVSASRVFFVTRNPNWVRYQGDSALEFDLPQSEIKDHLMLEDGFPVLHMCGYFSENGYQTEGDWRGVQEWLWEVSFV